MRLAFIIFSLLLFCLFSTPSFGQDTQRRNIEVQAIKVRYYFSDSLKIHEPSISIKQLKGQKTEAKIYFNEIEK